MKKDKDKAVKPEEQPEKEAPTETAEQPNEPKETQQSETITVDRKQLEEASRQFEETKAQRDEYLNMAKRVQAEFDNYRKRNATLRTDAEDEGVRMSVLALLPTLDNLERALAASDEESPLRSGVEMTLKGMMDALAKLGMEKVPCEKGKPFDPEMHNAVMTGEADEKNEAGTVMEVFQSGYSVRGKVIRYAMVKVAK